MLRILVILIIGGVIGAGIGFAGGIFVYPYIFLADVVANETLDASNRQAVADGTFIHANPSDPVHYGKGPVTVFRDLVRIENGFRPWSDSIARRRTSRIRAMSRMPNSRTSRISRHGFEVGPGPKYHVYLVKKKDVKNSSDVKDAEFKDLDFAHFGQPELSDPRALIPATMPAS